MFTFCFTTVAAAKMRHIRTSPKTIRTTGAFRAVKLGLAALAVLATASLAQAGGFNAHFTASNNGNRNSGNNSFSQSSQTKFNQGNNKFDSQKLDQHQTTAIDKLKTNKPPINFDNLKNNNKISLNENNNKSPLKLTGDNTGKVKLSLGNNFKLGDKIKLASGEKSNGKIKVLCDPCHKHCCSWWYCWSYPRWYPLYGCGCGYYDDVPVVVVPQGFDLQLLAVRLIDSGDPAEQLGPALRVWFRNNSPVAVNHPFNVLALAGRDAQPAADLPQAGIRVDAIEAGQTMAVDIRLPVAANEPGLPMFHVLVDSHREIPEANETNNGLVINRGEVQPLEIAQVTSGGNSAAAASDESPAPPAAPAIEGSTATTAATPASTAVTPASTAVSPAPVAMEEADAE